MTSAGRAEPIKEYPELADLAVLLREGCWVFPLQATSDDPVAGVREGADVTDVIVINDPDDVTVARMFTEDWRARDHDGPRWLLWYFTGPLRAAVAELRAVPPHGHAGAPTMRVPAPRRFWTPPRMW